MNITLLKAKIHRAVVKQADLDYVGSITIDSDLLRESGIRPMPLPVRLVLASSV